MNRQEIFDSVVRHLFAQGMPSKGKNEEGEVVCRYYTEDGLKCSIGVLIPQQFYDPAIEGLEIRDLKRYKLYDFLGGKQNEEFLRDLQIVHDICSLKEDGSFDFDSLHSWLKRTGTNYNLDVRFLQATYNEHKSGYKSL